jgi:hypothetical protein
MLISILNNQGTKVSKAIVGPTGILQTGGNFYAYNGPDTIFVNNGGELSDIKHRYNTT